MGKHDKKTQDAFAGEGRLGNEVETVPPPPPETEFVRTADGSIREQPKEPSLEVTVSHDIGRIADALERLADKFAPRIEQLRTMPNPRAHLKTCAKGHGMQQTDDYCQTCYAEAHGPTGPTAA